MFWKVTPVKGPCRHMKYGRCTNHFWNVMKASGKPGLREYTCRLWRDKMKSLAAYHDAVWRAKCFGLDATKRRSAGTKAMAGITSECPDYRPTPAGILPGAIQCRYFFLETCLLTFPDCPGACSDYLPSGDRS